MIFAELHNKLGSNPLRAHEKSEDILTSTVFGLLRYLPFQDGLLACLRSSKKVKFDKGQIEVAANAEWLNDIAAHELIFWRRFGKFGEPDIIVLLKDNNGEIVHIALIEVKLYSGKSGEADDDDEVDDEIVDPDQLVKYWQALDADTSYRGIPKSIIYLTSHSIPPDDALMGSVRRKPEMQLRWLSWSEIWTVMDAIPNEHPQKLIAQDIAQLLGHKGFNRFSGIHVANFEAPSVDRFWNKSGWFSQSGYIYPVRGFWRKSTK